MHVLLDREHPGAALGCQRREQRCLAARAGAEVDPDLVRAVDDGVGQRERDQLRAFVLDAGPALRDRGDAGRVAALEDHAVGRVRRRRTGQLGDAPPGPAARPG